MSFEKDTSLIIKDLWEAVDNVVAHSESEFLLLRKIYETVGLEYNESISKINLLSEIVTKIENLQSEKDNIIYQLNENIENIVKIEQLEREIQSLNEKNKTLSSDNEKYLSEISNLRVIEKDIEFTKQEIGRKNKDLHFKNSELEKLKEEIASKENLIYKLQNQQLANNEKAELQSASEIAQLSEENKELKQKLTKCEEEIEEQNFTIEEFNLKLVSLADEKTESNRRCEQLKRNYELLNLRIESLAKENEELQAKTNELVVYQKLAENREKELEAKNINNKNLADEIENLKTKLDEANLENLRLTEKITSSSIQNGVSFDEVQKEKEYYKDKLKTAEAILGEISKQLSEKDSFIEKLKSNESNSNQVEVSELKAKIITLEEKLSQSENDFVYFDEIILNKQKAKELLESQKHKINELNDNFANISNLAEKRMLEIQELQKEKESKQSIKVSFDKERIINQIDELVHKLEKFVV